MTPQQVSGWIILTLVFAYLIGAIPTGYIIAKQAKGIDIREHGSGNVGATNVKRVVGVKAGFLTLLLDALKGFFPTLLVVLLVPEHRDPQHWLAAGTGMMTIIGHSRSIFLHFSGGKSVITSLGVFMALFPLPALVTGLIGVSVIALTRYVSLGSLMGALSLPVLVWVFHSPHSYFVLSCFVAAYVVYLHRSNIARLMKQQENRL